MDFVEGSTDVTVCHADQLRCIGMARDSETYHACAKVGAVFDLEICSRMQFYLGRVSDERLAQFGPAWRNLISKNSCHFRPSTTDLSIGGYFSLLRMVILPAYPFSLKLSTAWNVPLPPPTISTPPFPPPRSLVEDSFGARVMLSLIVRTGSAVTCILPPETWAWKE
jgi:hypothetical protein